MLERRRVIGSGVVAGVTGVLGASAAANAAAADDDGRTAAAIDRLRAVLEKQFDAC